MDDKETRAMIEMACRNVQLPPLVVGPVDRVEVTTEIMRKLQDELMRGVSEAFDDYVINVFPTVATTREWCAFWGIPLPPRHHPKTRFR